MGIDGRRVVQVAALLGAGLWMVDRSVVVLAWLSVLMGFTISPAMTGPLERASRSWITPLRRLAAWDLDVASGSQACEALERRLVDTRDPWVWGVAARHAARHHDEAELRPALDAGLAAAAAGLPDAEPREGGLWALGLLGEGLPLCLQALPAAEPDVRAAAARCVGRVDAQQAHTAALIDRLAQESDRAVVVALAEVLAERDGVGLVAAMERAAGIEAQVVELVAQGGRPWGRAWVLGLARGQGPLRGGAFDALEGLGWGDDVKALCRERLSTPAGHGPADKVGPTELNELWGCRRAVVKGMGVRGETIDDVRAALRE